MSPVVAACYASKTAKLTPVAGSPADIQRLSALNGDLWAATGKGLWRYADGFKTMKDSSALERPHYTEPCRIRVSADGHYHVSAGHYVPQTCRMSTSRVLAQLHNLLWPQLLQVCFGRTVGKGPRSWPIRSSYKCARPSIPQ